MGTRGPKSGASLTVATVNHAKPQPPSTLEAEAVPLWRAIVNRFAADYFTAADLELLAEFCRISKVYIPAVEQDIKDEGASAKHLSTKMMLTKNLAMLATKLRLCVSSRTRGDTAAMRKAGGKTGIDWSQT